MCLLQLISFSLPFIFLCSFIIQFIYIFYQCCIQLYFNQYIMSEESIKIKTCIIGNMSVGKTSIILRIHEDEFKMKTVPTSGVDYNSKRQTINGQTVNVQLWDTTGQDRFRNVVSNFFRGAQGFFLTFDITCQKSLQELQIWIKQVNQKLEADVPKVLIANKIDLQPQLTVNQQEMVKKYCTKYNMDFFKVSAKTGQNVGKVYQTLIEQAYTYYYSQRKEKTVPVVIETKKKQKKKSCC